MPTPPAGRRTRALLVVLTGLVLVVATAVPAAADAAPPDVTYQPPVDAPVADPFRPPDHAYGPGNRGLTYDLPAGTPVRAAGEGTVVFAGRVAGTRHVTVLHADGLRTSYSFLDEVLVRRGEAIRRGDIVGLAGVGFHLGAREGDAYVDPAALFDADVVRVRLVAHGEPLPPTDAGLLAEQAALRDLVRKERPGFLERAIGAVVSRAAPVAAELRDVALAGWHTWEQLSPSELIDGATASIARHLDQECTPGSAAAPPPEGPRTALLVAGLGSSSSHGSIDEVDLDALGYEAGEAIRYSYGGGRTPASGRLHPGLAGIPEADYRPADTLGDIRDRGRELATLIEQAAAARPGVPIDIYAHSLGGLVTRVALAELAERPGGLDVLGQVVTIGTPHRGSDLATMAQLSKVNDADDVVLLRRLLGAEIDPYSTAVSQMAESSPFIHELSGLGVPAGVRFRTVAARGDMVVAADKADVDGHPSAITDDLGLSAHSALPGHHQTTRELALGLAGLPPACQSLLDAIADGVVPEVFQGAIDGLGLGMVVG